MGTLSVEFVMVPMREEAQNRSINKVSAKASARTQKRG